METASNHEISGKYPHALMLLEVLLVAWIFSGVMGKLIPVFYIPVVKSLRPHYFIACLMAGVTLVNFFALKYSFGSATSFNFLSIAAWSAYVGVALVSFINLKPYEFFSYPRKIGTDSLFIKWAFTVVLLFLFIHFYEAAKLRKDLIRKMVKTLDWSFVVYFPLAWALFLALITKKISVETYNLFIVPADELDPNLIRFSPGDYPNGTGEIIAVYIVFLLLMRRHLRFVPIKMMIALPALLLTGTRAGILPALTILVLFFACAFFRKLFSANLYQIPYAFLIMCAGAVAAGVGGLLYYKSINYFAARAVTLYNGIVNIEQSGSVLKRLLVWQQALNISQNSTFLGDGFGKYGGTHNLFLQMFAEIGVIGALFYVLFILLRLLAVSDVYLRYTRNSRSIEADFVRMLLVAAPVNAGFALTNHNLFHFIFWFLCLATFIVEGHFTAFGRPLPTGPIGKESR